MELPARIGKYELQELLGGGMSRVYRARDTVLGRTVVVKILTEQAAKDAEAKARFLREARVAGNLSHDNVISVYDFGEEEGRPYMVMEFLRGDDLRGLIKTNRTGDLNCRLRIAIQLARALEHIHAHKIIHRDIKPDNIQVTASGVVKLMDFGIAKAEDTALTRPGFTLGTPFYMAPEQIRGQQVTNLVDIYAFGVLLFELLTGVRPIGGDTIERIFYEILYQPVDLKPLETANVPDSVRQLVARATSKEPAGRPQSFSEVCAELERALRRLERGANAPEEPEPAGPVTAPGAPAASAAVSAPTPAEPMRAAPLLPAAKWNWKLIGLAAAGVVMFAAAIALYFSGPPSSKLGPTLNTPTGQMVLVPGGAFLLGPDQSRVTLRPFYIDRTTVTNAAWARFCAEQKRPLPPEFDADRPELPVVDVSFEDAQAFAKWAGKRLPTGQEWESAARGEDGRRFPWGDERDPNLANTRDNPDSGEPGLVPAASMPEGASPYGALNMLGNVWQLVDEPRTPSLATLQAFESLLRPPPTAFEHWVAIRGGA
ncbi:MAG: bifunctional serine/threonine-protein kinase/formylglycine-generating enzyme family protein, partial [Bryobacteraceae bacterium]